MRPHETSVIVDSRLLEANVLNARVAGCSSSNGVGGNNDVCSSLIWTIPVKTDLNKLNSAIIERLWKGH